MMLGAISVIELSSEISRPASKPSPTIISTVWFHSGRAAMHAAVAANFPDLFVEAHGHGRQSRHPVDIAAFRFRHVDGDQIVSRDLAECGKILAHEDLFHP